MPTCYVCRKKKPTAEFALRKGTERHKNCKACKREYNKKWYQRNRSSHLQAVLKNSRRYYKELSLWIRGLKDRPCTDCKKKYPYYVMHFDHLGRARKEGHISRMVASRLPKEKIEAELRKCELVCANCHAERTHRRRKKMAYELDAGEAF